MESDAKIEETLSLTNCRIDEWLSGKEPWESWL